MSTGSDPRDALARAVRFVAAAQLPSGEIPVMASTDPQLERGCAPDPSIFPTAVAAHCLSFCPDAAPIAARARAFLRAEMGQGGLWRHWTRAHPHHASLPPDLDDTSCASAVLANAREPVPDNRALLLSNRDRRGLFLTWLIPRLPPRRHQGRVAWAQILHLPTLFLFFRQTSAALGDVDAAVNANCLFYIGEFEGREAVAESLLEILRTGTEAACDKWYENPFVIWYFFARALGPSSDEARSLILARLSTASPANALEEALAACARLSCGETVDDAAMARLLAGQSEAGGWPAAALYHGGRERRRGGGFDAPHPDTPRWGSEALTTAFCIEALSRTLAGSKA
jgi:hypothetical protein